MIENILTAYGLPASACTIERIGEGLINYTWKVTCQQQQFILQQVNTQVFTKPQDIAYNLHLLNAFFIQQAKDYVFVAPLPALSGQSFIETEQGHFRLFPFVINSRSISTVNTATEAWEAAAQFGRFTRLLDGFDVSWLKYTLTNFHNLPLRYAQLTEALLHTTDERKQLSRDALQQVLWQKEILHTYERLIHNNQLPLRVIHHDTKISNVLFDNKGKGLCVIDLDTVMPGYFISDVGDMMRTYLSPANEEEKDFSKVVVRPEFLQAVYDGYMQEMGDVLTEAEKQNFLFAGEYIIYMQAIRFLTDFLQNDTYYHSTYPLQNLVRAGNQLQLLAAYQQAIPAFTQLLTQRLTTV